MTKFKMKSRTNIEVKKSNSCTSSLRYFKNKLLLDKWLKEEINKNDNKKL